MITKNLDIKSIFILILGAALILMFIAGKQGYISNYKDETKKLEKLNDILKTKNDSLIQANNELDKQINGYNEMTFDLTNQLDSAKVTINKLKKRRNEIPIKVNNMSVYNVTNAFTVYLERKSKSPVTDK